MLPLSLQGLEKVKKGLFSRLHDIARAEIFPAAMLNRPPAGVPKGREKEVGDLLAPAPKPTPDVSSSERKLFKTSVQKTSERP